MRRRWCAASALLVLLVVGVHSSERGDRLQRYVDWLQNAGVVGPVEWVEIEGAGIGCRATRDIEEGERYLSVPESLHLRESNLTMLYWKDWPLDEARLYPFIAFLIIESNSPNSQWKPLMDILPENHYGLPFYWTDEELAWAAPSSLSDSVAAQREACERSYVPFRDIMLSRGYPEEWYSYDIYAWAHHSVQSRTWRIADQQRIMVPGMDMLNHNSQGPYASLSSDFSSFHINATAGYKKGEEVYCNYGEKSDEDLLLIYGFVEDNPYGKANLILPKLLDKKLMRPQLEELYSLGQSLTLGHNQNWIENLVVPLRLASLTPAELTSRAGKTTSEGSAVSIQNELKALRRGISDIKDFLNQFPPVEEDIELLKSEGISYKKRCAITVRKMYKEVLRSTLEDLRRLWRSHIGPVPTYKL